MNDGQRAGETDTRLRSTSAGAGDGEGEGSALARGAAELVASELGAASPAMLAAGVPAVHAVLSPEEARGAAHRAARPRLDPDRRCFKVRKMSGRGGIPSTWFEPLCGSKREAPRMTHDALRVTCPRCVAFLIRGGSLPMPDLTPAAGPETPAEAAPVALGLPGAWGATPTTRPNLARLRVELERFEAVHARFRRRFGRPFTQDEQDHAEGRAHRRTWEAMQSLRRDLAAHNTGEHVAELLAPDLVVELRPYQRAAVEYLRTETRPLTLGLPTSRAELDDLHPQDARRFHPAAEEPEEGDELEPGAPVDLYTPNLVRIYGTVEIGSATGRVNWFVGDDGKPEPGEFDVSGDWETERTPEGDSLLLDATFSEWPLPDCLMVPEGAPAPTVRPWAVGLPVYNHAAKWRGVVTDLGPTPAVVFPGEPTGPRAPLNVWVLWLEGRNAGDVWEVATALLDILPSTETPLAHVLRAVELLKQARALLAGAGATKAADKVRAALSSAAGAVRHQENAPHRLARLVARTSAPTTTGEG